jgi:hypothetical protein
LGQRTTISTLSIIFGRYPQTEKERESGDHLKLSRSVIRNHFDTALARRARPVVSDYFNVTAENATGA